MRDAPLHQTYLKSFEVSIKYVSCHLQNMTEWLLCRCNAGDFYEYFMLNMFILFLITIIAATMLLCYQLFSFLQWIWIYINMLKFRTIFIFMWYCNYLLYVSRGENSNIASSPQRYHVLSLKTRSDTLWREIGQWDWGIWGRGLDFIQVSLKRETVAENPRRIDFKSVAKSFSLKGRICCCYPLRESFYSNEMYLLLHNLPCQSHPDLVV